MAFVIFSEYNNEYRLSIFYFIFFSHCPHRDLWEHSI